MRIGITDSGVGGLSVCAEIEAMLRESPIEQDIELVYLNAAIEDHYSYNSMPDRQSKLQAFDRFLHSVDEKYQPDLLFIACNTLSILYEDRYFDHHRHLPIKGIVDLGVTEMLNEYERDSDTAIIIFATPTTIDEGVYGKSLLKQGVPAAQIVEQACPGLPDAISNDGSGRLAREMLKEFVPAALEQFEQMPEKVAAFLGCTHYGYQAGEFDSALQAHVSDVKILNPNKGAADSIISSLQSRPGHGTLKVEFVARYVIPDVVVNSLSVYIGGRAPASWSAIKNFTHRSDLCGELLQ